MGWSLSGSWDRITAFWKSRYVGQDPASVALNTGLGVSPWMKRYTVSRRNQLGECVVLGLGAGNVGSEPRRECLLTFYLQTR